MTIAEKLIELREIEREQARRFKIPDGVKFKDYSSYAVWANQTVPKQPLYADFLKGQFSKDGKPCSFEDIFKLTRPSDAWQIVDRTLYKYSPNEARLSGKGLLLEKGSTNHFTYNTDLNSINGAHRVFSEVTGHTAVAVPLKGGYPGATSSFELPSDFEGVLSFMADTDESYLMWRLHGFMQEEPENWYGGGITNNVKIDKNVISEYRERGILISYPRDKPEKESIIHYIQLEPGAVSSSIIVTENEAVTRADETLELRNGNGEIVMDADSGITYADGKFSGFGFIRKVEIK